MGTDGTGTDQGQTEVATAGRVAAGAGRLVAPVRGLADRYRDLLTMPAPRRLLGAAALSYIGDRFNMLALITLSWQLGGGALGVGATLALMMLPRLVLQAGAGALVDRFPGRRLLFVTQIGLAVVAGSFALLSVVDSLWLLYILSFLLAAGRTVEMPAFEVRLMSVVPPVQRGAANAAHSLAMTTGDLAGPLLGAAVLALVGTTPLFLVNAVTFIALALIVVRQPVGLAARETTAAASDGTGEAALSTGSIPGPLATGGYLNLVRQPDILGYLGLVVASSAMLLGTIALFAERSYALGLGAGGVGLCYTVMGVGTLVGGALSGAGSYLTSRALLVAAAATTAAAVGQIAFGSLGLVVLALGALVLAGIASEIEETAIFTYFQNRVSPDRFGRLFSLIMMGNGLGGVMGALGVPLLARDFGAGMALALVAVPTVACATILVVIGMRRVVEAAPVVNPASS